ncbi:MAG: hypothetical protein F9K19_13665, partial [Rhizobiaceae bacterium]
MSTAGAYLRLARAGWVLVREGVVAALPGDQLTGLAGFGWRVSRALTRRSARECVHLVLEPGEVVERTS